MGAPFIGPLKKCTNGDMLERATLDLLRCKMMQVSTSNVPLGDSRQTYPVDPCGDMIIQKAFLEGDLQLGKIQRF